jgi:NAD(P)-dependent dehydrogenase (short-subunit alcohol dehydrogenase family)
VKSPRRVAAVFSPSRPPGIGLEVVRLLLAADLEVVCVDHAVPGGDPTSTHVGRKEWLDALELECRTQGKPIRVVHRDVTLPGGIEQSIAELVALAGRIDVAVIQNGATGSAAGSASFLEVSGPLALRALELNLAVPFLVAQACARQMIRQGGGGSIVFQSSYAAVAPASRNGMFGAARAGLNHMVRGFAQELGPHGIRINAVNPLAIVPDGDVSANPGIARLVAESGKPADQKFRDMIPLGRPQTRAETASVMVYLALEASFVTGECWTIAGGALSE